MYFKMFIKTYKNGHNINISNHKRIMKKEQIKNAYNSSIEFASKFIFGAIKIVEIVVYQATYSTRRIVEETAQVVKLK